MHGAGSGIAATTFPITRYEKRSSRPAKTMKAARGKMLAVSTHWEVESEPCRAAIVCGMASGTAVWSTRIMLLARVMATSVAQRARAPSSATCSITPCACHEARLHTREGADTTRVAALRDHGPSPAVSSAPFGIIRAGQQGRCFMRALRGRPYHLHLKTCPWLGPRGRFARGRFTYG